MHLFFLRWIFLLRFAPRAHSEKQDWWHHLFWQNLQSGRGGQFDELPAAVQDFQPAGSLNSTVDATRVLPTTHFR